MCMHTFITFIIEKIAASSYFPKKLRYSGEIKPIAVDI